MAGFGVLRKSLGTVSVVCSVVLLLVPTRHYSVLGSGHAVGGAEGELTTDDKNEGL